MALLHSSQARGRRPSLPQQTAALIAVAELDSADLHQADMRAWLSARSFVATSYLGQQKRNTGVDLAGAKKGASIFIEVHVSRLEFGSIYPGFDSVAVDI